MTYQGFLKKSRTYDFAALLVIFGVIQANLHMLNLPPPYNGIITIVVGIIVGILRHKTTGPVGVK